MYTHIRDRYIEIETNTLARVLGAPTFLNREIYHLLMLTTASALCRIAVNTRLYVPARHKMYTKTNKRALFDFYTRTIL